jgi:hypothetical protein
MNATGQVRLCRTKRVLAMEVEILKRTGAYFARENPIVAYRHHPVCRFALLTGRRGRRLSFGSAF